MTSSSGRSLNQIWKEAQFYKSEYDLETTLEISLFLKWKEPHRDEFFLSPILFKPAKIKRIRKIETEYSVSIEDEEFTVNPVLTHSFQRFFDISLPEKCSDLDVFCTLVKEQIETTKTGVQLCTEFDEKEEWQLLRRTVIGNFNYKKSLLGQDYRNIIDKPTAEVGRLLGDSKPDSRKHLLSTHQITSLDFSQKEALEFSNISDLVIQGPPGTGKSHTIVGLVGNYLAAGQKVLFVSQKKSALEVVYERLKSLELDHLTAFLNTEKNEKKEFFSDLKDSWEMMSQPLVKKESAPLKKHNPLQDYFFESYQRDNDKLGCSFHETVLDLINSGFSIQEMQYNGSLPSASDWKKNFSFLKDLESHLNENHGIESLHAAAFLSLNKSVFAEKDPIRILNSRLDEMSELFSKIEQIESTLNTASSLKEFTQLCLASSILGMVNKNQLELLDSETKNYKSFGNAAKKYQLLKTKVERAQQASANWKNKPTKTEITELIDLLKHHHAPKGILGILKRRNERLEEAFKDFDKELSDVGKLQLLEELRSEWNLVTELQEIEIKLKHQYNLLDPSTEVNHILQVRHKLSSISQNAYLTLLEQEHSDELIKSLAAFHPEIQKLNGLARFIFQGDNFSTVKEGLTAISLIKKHIPSLKLLAPELQRFFMFPAVLREYVISRPFSISKLDAIVKYNGLLEQSRFDVEFSRLTGANLQAQLDQVKRDETQIIEANIKKIQEQFHGEIRALEDLLATPASKLKQDQKDFKKSLKAVKRTLIHEIGKKQRHMPLKEFSEACWQYLSALQPVWIMNPLAVSERLNCAEEMFDVVIFDEASQIPLEDAIPAIQRAKKVIVVGDSKQMPPGNFFSNKSDTVTLLDRASNAFKSVMLKWHYRSEHPALINFSNLHFYEGELLTPPQAHNQHPIRFVDSKGTFTASKNLPEAEIIAKEVKHLSNEARSNLAIISFSKEQENTIRTALDKAKIQSDDILIRNLENVQGIERDTVFISIGYAKDPEGKFRMNFGPINQESGANRLNVLFTRAKKNITVFSSVLADDFGLSDNQGVSCLKDYIAYASTPDNLKFKDLPEGLPEVNNVVMMDYQTGSCIRAFINFEKSKLLLLDPCTTSTEVKDLETIYHFLKSRFRQVKIMLSIDRLNHPEAFNEDFKKYFAD